VEPDGFLLFYAPPPYTILPTLHLYLVSGSDYSLL
jgi:hypothetical protein